MLTEQRRVSQMATVVRLRAMQSDNASQRYALAANTLTRAQAELTRNQGLYSDTAERFLKQRETGISLDLALYEAQLQGLLALRKTLAESETHVHEADADLLVAKSALTDSRVNRHIAEKALARAETALAQYWYALEVVEVSDAQLAKEGAGGV